MQVRLSLRLVCVRPPPPGQGLSFGEGAPARLSPCRSPYLRHSTPSSTQPERGPGWAGEPRARGSPRPSRGAFTREPCADGYKQPLVSPPTTPLSLRGLARPGSDRRAGKIEDETDALHAQRGCLPRLPAQRRQAQEAVRQVLHHAQRHGLAQAAEPPREHDRVVQHGVQRAGLRGRGREMRRRRGRTEAGDTRMGAENRRMSLTGLFLASPSPERPTLSLPLPRLSKPSPALRSQQDCKSKRATLTPSVHPLPGLPSCWHTLPKAALSPFPPTRLPGSSFLQELQAPASPTPRLLHLPGLALTTMCTGGRVCSMLSGASSGDMKGFLTMGAE